MDGADDTILTEPRVAELAVVPANEASWPDLRTIFGTIGDPGHCYCQWFKVRQRDWSATSVAERRDRQRGARALEAYPLRTAPGQAVSTGLLYVGTRQIFAAAGFTEVSCPAPGRVVMRVDFG